MAHKALDAAVEEIIGRQYERPAIPAGLEIPEVELPVRPVLYGKTGRMGQRKNSLRRNIVDHIAGSH